MSLEEMASPCPLTCRGLFDGSHEVCSNSTGDNMCVPGCYCPAGYVLLNSSSEICVPIKNCPCYFKGKVIIRCTLIEHILLCYN